jgi:hypothetical protein
MMIMMTRNLYGKFSQNYDGRKVPRGVPFITRVSILECTKGKFLNFFVLCIHNTYATQIITRSHGHEWSVFRKCTTYEHV